MVKIAMFKKHQLLAAILLVSLVLLVASVLTVVLNHRSKPRIDSSEDATEKLRIMSSTLKAVSLDCSAKYRGYCLNGGKCARLTDPLVVACFCKSLYVTIFIQRTKSVLTISRQEKVLQRFHQCIAMLSPQPVVIDLEGYRLTNQPFILRNYQSEA